MPRMQKHYPRVTPIPAGNPASAGYTSALVRQQFAHHLKKLMAKKGMSQSDLARAAFGLDDPESGSKVPKGRDRISAYLNARQFPDDDNLKALAKALGMAPEDLTPKIDPETSLKSEQVFDVQRHPNSTRARVVLIQDLEMEIVLKIMGLLVAHPEEGADQPVAQAKLGDSRPKANPAAKRAVLSLPKSNPTPAPQLCAIAKKKKADDEEWAGSYQEDPLGLSEFLRS